MSSIQPGQFSFPPPSTFLNPAMQQVPPMQGVPMSQYSPGMPSGYPAFAGRKTQAGSAGANQHFIGTLSIASLALLGLAYLGIKSVFKGFSGNFKHLGDLFDKTIKFAKTQWEKIPGAAKKAAEAVETATAA